MPWAASPMQHLAGQAHPSGRQARLAMMVRPASISTPVASRTALESESREAIWAALVFRVKPQQQQVVLAQLLAAPRLLAHLSVAAPGATHSASRLHKHRAQEPTRLTKCLAKALQASHSVEPQVAALAVLRVEAHSTSAASRIAAPAEGRHQARAEAGLETSAIGSKTERFSRCCSEDSNCVAVL